MPVVLATMMMTLMVMMIMMIMMMMMMMMVVMIEIVHIHNINIRIIHSIHRIFMHLGLIRSASFHAYFFFPSPVFLAAASLPFLSR